MVRVAKKLGCVVLCMALILSLSGCSGNNKLTEENVTATVETATTALKNFDSKTLNKYVDSATLSYILKFSEKHEQFSTLGKAIFENLEIEIDSIDLEANEVTVKVKNKYLSLVASSFTQKLLIEHSKFQLLTLLDDESFLNNSLGELTSNISQADMQEDYITVKLRITQGKKNLVLHFDDEAENAVSGGALKAIKSLI